MKRYQGRSQEPAVFSSAVEQILKMILSVEVETVGFCLSNSGGFKSLYNQLVDLKAELLELKVFIAQFPFLFRMFLGLHL